MSKRPRAPDALHFLPLGGANEIGMNLSLYGCDGKWLMVDLGVTFGDASTPGIDVIMPDIGFIEDRRADLLGLVLTHAHEDHFGAVQYLWPRLRCPIYATPFTAAFLKLKLSETDFGGEVDIRIVPLSGHVRLDPFEVTFVTMTHSIPEPNALVVRTRFGTVVHSGDWKLDPAPQIGGLTDEARLRHVGEQGVLALVCDSTNALLAGHSMSEAEVRTNLIRLMSQQEQRIAVTCFATNVARLKSIVEAAHLNGRHCGLVGRSLWRVREAAAACGYLNPPEAFVPESEIGYLPRDKVVLICTGSQGEPRSALSRIAFDSHPHVVLEEGDTVIYSSREIPGNEKAIGRVQNALVRLGVNLITPDEAPVHASGHPAQEELIALYGWLRPRIAVPVHGEPKHLEAHARLAEACQVPQIIVPFNGAMIRLAPGPAEVVEEVETGRLAIDGTRLVPLEGDLLRHRNRMTHNGAAVVTLVLDARGQLAAEPVITLMGLDASPGRAGLEEDLADDVRLAVEDLPPARRRDDNLMRDAAATAIRRRVKSWSGKKPLTEVHLVRLGA